MRIKWGRIILVIIVIFTVRGYTHIHKKIFLESKVFVEQGTTLRSLLPSELSSLQKMYRRRKLRKETELANNLHVGMYILSGTYNVGEFITTLKAGPKEETISLTILEGRSIYDIDQALTRKNYSTPGEFIAYVTNPATIQEQKIEFPWIENTTTLEGYLYPDTYFVGANGNIMTQLVKSQLRAYNAKVIIPLGSKIGTAIDRMRAIQVSMSPYQFLTLASIIEKEEKNHANQSRIGGLFVNRLVQGMRIDADISLCYGLKQPYSECTVDIIIKNLTDASNPYNTRAVLGLPPTPIANPSAETLARLADREKSDYLYYLHDSQGQIFFGKTIEEHNLNKSKYLGN